jgi:hypothetical protein
MTDGQLLVWSKMIATAMNAGDMEKVTELYGKVSEAGSMEDAAKLEQMVAAALSK